MRTKFRYVFLALIVVAVSATFLGCSNKLTAKDVAKIAVERIESIKTLKARIYMRGEQNDTVYWVMKKPDKSYARHANGYTIILNGTKEWDYIPEKKEWICYRVERISVLNGEAAYKSILRLLRNKDIRLLGEKDGCYILEVRQNNTTMEVWISKKLEFPVKVVGYKNGKFAGVIVFKDVEINVPVNDSLFYPKGGKIVNASKLVDLEIQTAKTGEISLKEIEGEFGVKLFVPSVKGLKYEGGMYYSNVESMFVSFDLVLNYEMNGHNVSLDESYPCGNVTFESPAQSRGTVTYSGLKVKYFVNVQSGGNECNMTFFQTKNYTVTITSDLPAKELLRITESAISNGLSSNAPPIKVSATIFYQIHKSVLADSIQKYFKYLNFKPVMFSRGKLETVYIDDYSDSITLGYMYKTESISVLESKKIKILPNTTKQGKYYVYSEKWGNFTSLHLVFEHNGIWIDVDIEPYNHMSRAEEMKLLMEFLT